MKIVSEKIERGSSPAHDSIRWIMLIEIAFKNLFYKKLRTSLTVIGVVIGVGAVVFLLAFGFGLRDVVSKQVVDSSSIRTIDVETAKSQLVKLNQETVNIIKDMQSVDEVARVYSEAGTTSFENSQIESVLYGVDQAYLDLSNPKLKAGAPPEFTKDDQIFVNDSYVKAIGEGEASSLVGKPLEITYEAPVPSTNKEASESAKTTKATFNGTVAGILETGSGAEIYVSSAVFEAAGFQNASQLKVLSRSQEAVPEIQKKIETLGLLTNSPLSTLEQINQVFGFLNLLFLAFGGIGLIIAVLGMFNTLTISLLERIREIGLMITLGARRKDVRRLFIVEAVGLSLIGGVCGVATSYALSRIVDAVLNQFAKGRGVTDSFTVFTFYPQLVLGVIASSALLGVLVVYLPAKRAANINPIEALKS